MARKRDGPIAQLMGWLVIKFFASLCPMLGRHGAFVLGRAVGLLIYAVLRKRERETLAHLEMVYGDGMTPGERRRMARECYANTGGHFAEVLHICRRKPSRLPRCTEVVGEEHLRRALAGGRGAIIVSGHVGNFPLMGIELARRGWPVDVLLMPAFNPATEKVLTAIRRRVGLSHIYVAPRRRAAAECLRSLRTGRVLWMMIDQKFHGGILVDFLGRPSQVAPGASVLAVRAGATVLPACIHRLPNSKHRIEIGPPLEYERRRDGPATQRNMQRFSDIVGKFVLKYPEQWTWFHRRWKVRWRKIRNR